MLSFFLDLSLLAIGPGSLGNSSTSLSAKGQIMEINLHALAGANNGENKGLIENIIVSLFLLMISFCLL